MRNISSIQRFNRKLVNIDIPHGKIRLELGCGPEHLWYKAGKINLRLDIMDYGQDIIWDVEEGIPLADNSCEYIYSNQVFEHFEDIVGVFNECWRILKFDGYLHILVPHKDSAKSLLLSHTRVFDKYSFDFLQYESYASEYKSKMWEVVMNEVDVEQNVVLRAKPIK